MTSKMSFLTPCYITRMCSRISKRDRRWLKRNNKRKRKSKDRLKRRRNNLRSNRLGNKSKSSILDSINLLKS